MKLCNLCGKEFLRGARGFCGACYSKVWRGGGIARYPKMLMIEKRTKMLSVRRKTAFEDTKCLKRMTDACIAMRGNGGTLRTISEKLKISQDMVSRLLRFNGIKIENQNKNQWRLYDESDIADVVQMRGDGSTFQEVADWLGCSVSTAHRLHREWDVKQRNIC